MLTPVVRKGLHRHLSRVLASALLSLLALLSVLGGDTVPVLQGLEYVLYDARLRMTMPRGMDERIVIIDVDERSLAEVGRWPWSRQQLASLVQELVQGQQVRAFGLDVVFAEPELDPQSGDGLTLGPLAEAVTQVPVVLGYYFTSDGHGHRSGSLPQPLPGQMPWPGMLAWSGYGASISELSLLTSGAGFFNAISDPDGRVRSVPLLAGFENGLYESMALAMLRVGVTNSVLRLQRAEGAQSESRGVQRVELHSAQGSLRLPVDARGAVRVPFRGPGGAAGQSFPYISAADLLKGQVPAGSLQGRYALLGFTAPGLMDLRVTPVSSVYPGVEIHANVLSAALDGRLVAQPSWSAVYELGLLLGLGLILTLGLPRLALLPALGLGLSLLILLLAQNLYLYQMARLDLPLAHSLVLLLLSLIANIALGYRAERRSRRRLAREFASYVPPEIVNQMLHAPERYDMQAQTRELTVMFCDLRGFTRIAEAMPSEQLQALLFDLFGRISQVIIDHQGTIDKYMGDCVMAFWGAPMASREHARMAVDAALAIGHALEIFNAERRAAGLPPIRAGIGLSTGMVTVGNMGTAQRRTYTVIGDAVNLASRLEGLTARYGVDILASEATRRHPSTVNYLWQELDRVRVRGRQTTTTIHTPRGLAAEATAAVHAELAQWEAALTLWRQGAFQVFLKELAPLLNTASNPEPYRLFARRAEQMLHTPPSNWQTITSYEQR